MHSTMDIELFQGSSSPTCEHRKYGQNQEYNQQDLANPRGFASDASKAEHCSDYGYQKEG
jgi:hypothetical protein